MGQTVWVRETETEVVIVHVGNVGPFEVARHKATRPDTPAIIDARFLPPPTGAPERMIRPTGKADEEGSWTSSGRWPFTSRSALGPVSVRSVVGPDGVYVRDAVQGGGHERPPGRPAGPPRRAARRRGGS